MFRINRDLKKLKVLFPELLLFLEKHGNAGIRPQILTIKTIIDYMNNSDDGTKMKIMHVAKLHRSLYPPREGLSDFFIWDNDFQTRKQLNKPLDKVRDDIWAVLKKYRA
ncbi:hypothetical protein [Listeria booriae]|uniref:hypothetical protein n=1 Tax=Listeria booriae TaxID=1552123 RepID=UPI001623BC20|nr:hypothetical protein [Listeria booriae]MBC1357529.1 hypothetical protein [Listeria booriae]